MSAAVSKGLPVEVANFRTTFEQAIKGVAVVILIAVATYNVATYSGSRQSSASSSTSLGATSESIPLSTEGKKGLRIVVPPGECVLTPPVTEAGRQLSIETVGTLRYTYPGGTMCAGNQCSGGWSTVCIENRTKNNIDAFISMLPK